MRGFWAALCRGCLAGAQQWAQLGCGSGCSSLLRSSSMVLLLTCRQVGWWEQCQPSRGKWEFAKLQGWDLLWALGVTQDLPKIFSAQCAAWSGSVRLEFFERKLSPWGQVSDPLKTPAHFVVLWAIFYYSRSLEVRTICDSISTNNPREKTRRLVWGWQ